ncbi:MAG: hypothetical protein J6P61_02110 [Erysipelotrichaceae bacterium]|nr:hypothetical protein [Erysipelotrichaceae bacterium]
MNIAVVCIGRSKTVYDLAQSIADAAHTNVFDSGEFNHQQVVDLLLLGFDATIIGKKKEVLKFINDLKPDNVRNVALFSLYNLSNKLMDEAITNCTNHRLPLMREQYCCHITPFTKSLPEEFKEAARLYTQDMINVVINYY